jgi:ATP-dependent DNA ligase
MPIEDRKDLLRKLLGRSDAIRFNQHFECEGATLFDAACRLGLEGIVSRKRGSRYVSGRVKHWLKIKNPKSPSIRRIQDGTW